MYRYSLLIVSSLFFFLPFKVLAIQVSDLFVVANKEDKAVVTVTNVQDSRIFLNTSVSEIFLDKGDLREKKYTKNNIDEWKLNIFPARAILEPSFKKDIIMKFKCVEKKCDRNRDHVFKVGLVPVPYYEGELDASLVQFAIGFAPIVIVPANPAEIELEYSYSDSGALSLINHGKTFLYVDVIPKNCDVKISCKRPLKILAGRKFDLTADEFKGQQLEIKARTYRSVFKEEVVIRPGSKGVL
ncbi:hypothetical protein QTN94_18530 [Vibrio sp. M250220]